METLKRFLQRLMYSLGFVVLLSWLIIGGMWALQSFRNAGWFVAVSIAIYATLSYLLRDSFKIAKNKFRKISLQEKFLRILRVYGGTAILGLILWLIGEFFCLAINMDVAYFEMKVLIGLCVAVTIVIICIIIYFIIDFIAYVFRYKKIRNYLINAVLWLVILAICLGAFHLIFTYIKPLVI